MYTKIKKLSEISREIYLDIPLFSQFLHINQNLLICFPCLEFIEFSSRDELWKVIALAFLHVLRAYLVCLHVLVEQLCSVLI